MKKPKLETASIKQQFLDLEQTLWQKMKDGKVEQIQQDIREMYQMQFVLHKYNGRSGCYNRDYFLQHIIKGRFIEEIVTTLIFKERETPPLLEFLSYEKSDPEFVFNLPKDIIAYHIAHSMDIQTLGRFEQTSKEIREIIRSRNVWEFKFRERYSTFGLKPENCKQLFKSRLLWDIDSTPHGPLLIDPFLTPQNIGKYCLYAVRDSRICLLYPQQQCINIVPAFNVSVIAQQISYANGDDWKTFFIRVKKFVTVRDWTLRWVDTYTMELHSKNGSFWFCLKTGKPKSNILEKRIICKDAYVYNMDDNHLHVRDIETFKIVQSLEISEPLVCLSSTNMMYFGGKTRVRFDDSGAVKYETHAPYELLKNSTVYCCNGQYLVLREAIAAIRVITDFETFVLPVPRCGTHYVTEDGIYLGWGCKMLYIVDLNARIMLKTCSIPQIEYVRKIRITSMGIFLQTTECEKAILKFKNEA